LPYSSSEKKARVDVSLSLVSFGLHAVLAFLKICEFTLSQADVTFTSVENSYSNQNLGERLS